MKAAMSSTSRFHFSFIIPDFQAPFITCINLDSDMIALLVV